MNLVTRLVFSLHTGGVPATDNAGLVQKFSRSIFALRVLQKKQSRSQEMETAVSAKAERIKKTRFSVGYPRPDS
jgi:hypothetical protein